MTAAAHPTYPNPTIQEALCEIHFRLHDAAAWSSLWYGDFYKQVENQFPIILPSSTPQLQLQQGQPILLVPQVMRYQNVAGNLLLQLSENRIVVNVLPDYPGWMNVKEHIRYAWEKVCEVIDPAVVQRIGLRYINRIERRGKDETLGNWLLANDYIPQATLTSGPDFVSHVEARLNLQDRIHVTITDRPVSPEGFGTFTFDIDHVTEQEISVDTNLLLEEATRLHERIWEVFNSATGEQLKQLLQGEIL